MRITESQLRKIIREVIEEAHHNDRGMSRKDMHNMRPDLFDKDGKYKGADDSFNNSEEKHVSDMDDYEYERYLDSLR